VELTEEPGRPRNSGSPRARAPSSLIRLIRRRNACRRCSTTDLSLRSRSGVRRDLAAVHGAPRAAGRCICPGVGYKLTHPRHGAAGAGISARRFQRKRADLAGPIPAVNHKLIDAADIAALKAKILASGTVCLGAGFDSVGGGVDVPRIGQARRGERRADSPRAAEGLGSQPAGSTGQGAQGARKASRALLTVLPQAARRFRSPT